MKNVNHRTRLAVVPAVLAAFALSACQDSAPTAAPPTPASPTAEQQSQPPSEAPSEESSEAPESSQAPETSESSESSEGSDSSGSSAECEARTGQKIEREDVKPVERTKPQRVKGEYGDSELEITLGKPSVEASSGDDYFPGEGMQTLIVPITLKTTSGSNVVSELGMSVSDGSDEVCQRDIGSTVIPKSEGIPVETLKEGDSLSGKVAFAIPAGADLSKFTFNYAEDYNSGEADVVWKLK